MTDRIRAEWCLAAPPPGDVRPQPDVPALTRGQPIQVFRVGPLYDRETGELIDTIDDALLADIVRVFDATRDVEQIPIDWNHGSAFGETPQEGMAFGRPAELNHIPGVGLWAVPEYTERGTRVVAESGGVLHTSPEYCRGPVYDRSTGALLGNAKLLALALTNRPRQDRLAPVALSEVTPPACPAPSQTPASSRTQEATMADTPAQAPAPAMAGTMPLAAAPPDAGAAPSNPQAAAQPPAPAPENPAEKAAETMTLEMQVEQLQAENATLRQQVADLQTQLAAAQSSTVQMSERNRQTTAQTKALSDRVASLEKRTAEAEAKAAAAEKARLLDGYEARGLFLSDRRPFFERIYDRDRESFDQEIARLEQNPEVPVGQRATHSAPGTEARLLSERERLDKRIRERLDRDGVKPNSPEWSRRYSAAHREMKEAR